MQFLEIWHDCVKVHLKIDNSLDLGQDCKRFAVSLKSSQLCKATPEKCLKEIGLYQYCTDNFIFMMFFFSRRIFVLVFPKSLGMKDLGEF